MAGTSLPPSGTLEPTLAAGPTNDQQEPAAAPVTDRAVAGNPSGNSDSSDGLGQTGAIVVGVVCGAALLLGVAGLARWSKRRNSTVS